MGLNIKDEYGGSEAGVVAFSLAITELAGPVHLLPSPFR